MPDPQRDLATAVQFASDAIRAFNAQSPINVACPKCGAAPLHRCRRPAGGVASEMHQARWSAKFQQEREAT